MARSLRAATMTLTLYGKDEHFENAYVGEDVSVLYHTDQLQQFRLENLVFCVFVEHQLFSIGKSHGKEVIFQLLELCNEFFDSKELATDNRALIVGDSPLASATCELRLGRRATAQVKPKFYRTSNSPQAISSMIVHGFPVMVNRQPDMDNRQDLAFNILYGVNKWARKYPGPNLPVFGKPDPQRMWDEAARKGWIEFEDMVPPN